MTQAIHICCEQTPTIPPEEIAIAKRAGKYKTVGRKPALSGEQVNELRARLEKGAKVTALAREYGVSRQTVYSWVG